jgi:endonuclease V-like protein UPF0215 family
MNRVLILLVFLLSSCASMGYINEFDITDKTEWLESTEDNPIINVIQKNYKNNDVEIIIKKKLTTDYVKIRLTKKGKEISKRTVKNEEAL